MEKDKKARDDKTADWQDETRERRFLWKSHKKKKKDSTTQHILANNNSPWVFHTFEQHILPINKNKIDFT